MLLPTVELTNLTVGATWRSRSDLFSRIELSGCVANSNAVAEDFDFEMLGYHVAGWSRCVGVGKRPIEDGVATELCWRLVQHVSRMPSTLRQRVQSQLFSAISLVKPRLSANAFLNNGLVVHASLMYQSQTPQK